MLVHLLFVCNLLSINAQNANTQQSDTLETKRRAHYKQIVKDIFQEDKKDIVELEIANCGKKDCSVLIINN